MGNFSKRGESMRLEPKKHKRTPSFTTRRRTQSFRRHTKNMGTVQNLPPVEVDGFLDRKQELQTGGKRATIRSWKSYYTVLCGQLMCFFRDQEEFCLPPSLNRRIGIPVWSRQRRATARMGEEDKVPRRSPTFSAADQLTNSRSSLQQ